MRGGEEMIKCRVNEGGGGRVEEKGINENGAIQRKKKK